jgi:hypothetical protein
MALATALVCAGCSDGSSGGGDSGTTENSTLVWQNPSSENTYLWDGSGQAKAYCENLDTDGASDWRLPTIGELRTLISGCPETEVGGICGVNDECDLSDCWDDNCSGCEINEGGCYWQDGLSGPCSYYWASWSSTTPASWYIDFSNGAISSDDKLDGNYIRCVRNGTQ